MLQLGGLYTRSLFNSWVNQSNVNKVSCSRKQQQHQSVLSGNWTCILSRCPDHLAVLCHTHTHTHIFKPIHSAIMCLLVQDLLFSPSNLFLHLASSQAAGVPTFSDQFLMIDCFVALYRINHRNNHLATVCMAENAPAVFHVVLARALYTLLTQNSVLCWWPGKETVYSLAPTLRQLFQEYLNIVRRHDRTAFSPQVSFLMLWNFCTYFHCV